MKYLLSAFVLTSLIIACSPSKNLGRPDYTVVSDTETKVLRGVISRSLIENDTTFGWFKENMQLGMADEAAVNVLSKHKDHFSFIVFGGTWCHDTQNLLSKFYRMIDKSGFPADKVSLVGVDRDKTAPHDLHLKWKITNVPTFLVLKDGKEVGRVVEYGKTGNIEKELSDIIVSAER